MQHNKNDTKSLWHVPFTHGSYRVRGLLMFWKASEGFGRFLEATAASVRLWKALDALEGFGVFRSLWQGWMALGSFSEGWYVPYRVRGSIMLRCFLTSV